MGQQALKSSIRIVFRWEKPSDGVLIRLVVDGADVFKRELVRRVVARRGYYRVDVETSASDYYSVEWDFVFTGEPPSSSSLEVRASNIDAPLEKEKPASPKKRWANKGVVS